MIGLIEGRVPKRRQSVAVVIEDRTAAIEDDVGQPVGGLGRAQQMVDANPQIPGPGAGLVVPEGVLAGRIGDIAQGVRQPEAEQGLEGFAGGRAKQRIG